MIVFLLYQVQVPVQKYVITFFFWFSKNSCPARPKPTTLIYSYADRVPQRNAASDITTLRLALLMGGPGRSAVGVVVVAPDTSSFVERLLGNRGVEGRRN